MPEPWGVLGTTIEPPDLVMLDTSAVVEALFSDAVHHDQYADFLARAVLAGSTLAYCEMLDLELAQFCVKAARRRSDGRTRVVSYGRELIREVFLRWNTLTSQTRSVRIPLGLDERPDVLGSPVRDMAFRLIERHGVESYDTTHAATALILGAPLLTADGDFARIPSVTLIMHPGAVQAARRLRTQRG